MDNGWISQEERSLLDISCGSTVLIRFKDDSKGITADDNSTVDISWMRIGSGVFATSGQYSISDIDAWKPI